MSLSEFKNIHFRRFRVWLLRALSRRSRRAA